VRCRKMVIAVVLATGAVLVTEAAGVAPAVYAADQPALSAVQQSLIGARQWLNTQPLQAADLRGKVVLVNFWTYSCINSLRALPMSGPGLTNTRIAVW
jgi:hypothetical protein